MTISPSFRLDILRELRVRAGLTRIQAAQACGLWGRRSYQTVGAWERGELIPKVTRRAKLIGYLWDQLGLRHDVARFESVWDILVEEWHWEPILDQEWAAFTHQTRPPRSDTLDTRLTNNDHHIEHRLTLNYDQARPEEARDMVENWLEEILVNNQSKTPVRYEVRLQMLHRSPALRARAS